MDLQNIFYRQGVHTRPGSSSREDSWGGDFASTSLMTVVLMDTPQRLATTSALRSTAIWGSASRRAQMIATTSGVALNGPRGGTRCSTRPANPRTREPGTARATGGRSRDPCRRTPQSPSSRSSRRPRSAPPQPRWSPGAPGPPRAGAPTFQATASTAVPRARDHSGRAPRATSGYKPGGGRPSLDQERRDSSTSPPDRHRPPNPEAIRPPRYATLAST